MSAPIVQLCVPNGDMSENVNMSQIMKKMMNTIHKMYREDVEESTYQLVLLPYQEIHLPFRHQHLPYSEIAKQIQPNDKHNEHH